MTISPAEAARAFDCAARSTEQSNAPAADRGRGIVISAGGPKYTPCALAALERRLVPVRDVSERPYAIGRGDAAKVLPEDGTAC
jgi:hypothetical protein